MGIFGLRFRLHEGSIFSEVVSGIGQNCGCVWAVVVRGTGPAALGDVICPPLAFVLNVLISCLVLNHVS